MEHRHLPEPGRLSILSASILLVYALTPFIRIPDTEWQLVLPGVVFPLRLTFSSAMSFFVAILAAFGTGWLLSGHPHLRNRRLILHSLLPAMTAWAIGVPLETIAISSQWWIVFGFGGLLLSMVLVAEYITVDHDDIRYPPAAIGLTAVSFALYLVLSIALRAYGVRVYLLLPGLVLPAVLVCVRTLYLRLGGKWRWFWAIGIALFIGQIALALHYWPLSPLAYGLILLGFFYALTGMAGLLEEERPWRVLWIEPVLMLLILWLLAFVFGG